jgi:hypothetical protein
MFQTNLQQVKVDATNAQWKKDRLEAIRSFHQELINDLGIERSDFNMKMPFYDQKARMVVGIFASEFKKDKGFFFELVTRQLDPADEERKVYRVAPSGSYEEEYELNEKGSYLVPVEELRVVNPDSVAISKSSAVTASDNFLKGTQPLVERYKAPAPMEDAAYSEMTIRDYYAIHSGKPVSAKNWLNELIKNNK